MILQQEMINAGGELELYINSHFNVDTIGKYCRSYEVNRNGERVKLRYCNNRLNGCFGKGWLAGQDCKLGLGYIISCHCLDKTLEQMENKSNESERILEGRELD